MFQVGQTVYSKTLKKQAIIHSINGKKICLHIGSMAFYCEIDDLRELNKLEAKALFNNKKLPIKIVADSKKCPDSLDLHGCTIAIAIERLEEYLSMALLTKKNCVDIIHGHGTGKVMNAVHEYLKQATFVSKYERLEFNQGTTRVYIYY